MTPNRIKSTWYLSTDNSWTGKQNDRWHSYMFRNWIFIPTIQLECSVLAQLLSELFLPPSLCQYHNHKVCSKFYSSKIEDSLGVIIPCRKDSLERDSIFARSVRMGGLEIIFGSVLTRTLKSGICIFNIERLILWCLCRHTFMFSTVTSCADTLLSSLPQKKNNQQTDSQPASRTSHSSHTFFCWAQIEKSIVRKNPEYNQPWRTSATWVEIKK